MTELEKSLYAEAREATARRILKAVVKQERPVIAVAIILRAIDDWYKKGVAHGKLKTKEEE